MANLSVSQYTEYGTRGAGWSAFVPAQPGGQLAGTYLIRTKPADLQRAMTAARESVAKIAPDQISGVDAMAEELKAKAQVQSAEEMTQECKALRPIAEMMWTDECA